jgi:hypothetical protein
LTEATVRQFYSQIKHFLCWYGVFERDLADVQVGDVDAYLARGSARGWCRITANNVAGSGYRRQARGAIPAG